jgi:beta-phosphoglucomutase-like phosphatase (HAD superfamily)
MPDQREDECRLKRHMRPVRAVTFDFNGTLSDDEPILLSVYRELFAEHGRPLTDAEYYETLAGRSEEAIIATWLGVQGSALEALVEERIERYLGRCGRGETVSDAAREAVAFAAAHVPVAVVSGAFRREIEPVLSGALLDRHVSVLVAADDVERGKPDPACYALALELLGGVTPSDAVAFEDTEAGIASAKTAGLCCVAVVGTHPRDRLREADELVDAIDVDVLRRVLG